MSDQPRAPRSFVLPDLLPGDVLLHSTTLKPMLRVDDYEFRKVPVRGQRDLVLIIIDATEIPQEEKPT